MAVMDEFREERQALKDASFKKKWEYFLDYYKWYVIGGIAVIAFIISMVHNALTAKESALFGYFLNTYADIEQNEAFLNEFATAKEIDTKEYSLTIDTSLQYTKGGMDQNSYFTIQKIMVTLAAADVDFLAGDEDAFEYYATSDTFFDLREIYTDEELEKFKDYIYYVDMDVVREKAAVVDSGQFEDYEAPVYDHFKPEEMGDPIPIALCIQDCPKLDQTYYFHQGAIPMGVVVNTKHLETTKEFIDYLFEDLIQ